MERQSIYIFIYRDVFDSQNIYTHIYIYIYNNLVALDNQYNFFGIYSFVIDYQYIILIFSWCILSPFIYLNINL